MIAPRPSSQRAVSLLEMLVAFALISLLVAIIIPAAGHLRVSGKATKNISNHRTISTALIAYASDHQGQLPFANDKPAVSDMGDKRPYPRVLLISNYVSDPTVFFSPLLKEKWYLGRAFSNPLSDSVSPWFYTHYAVNRSGAMPYREKGYIPANLRAVAADGNLSRLMLTRDNYRAGYDTPEYPYGGGLLWFTSSADIPPLFRTYNGRVHAAFADGHVESFHRDEIAHLLDTSPATEAPLFSKKYTSP